MWVTTSPRSIHLGKTHGDTTLCCRSEWNHRLLDSSVDTRLPYPSGEDLCSMFARFVFSP